MLFHHIHRHKHGIKQTILSFALVLAFGGGLFFVLKPNSDSIAKENTTDQKEQNSINLLPDGSNEEIKTTDDNKAKKSKPAEYVAQPQGLPAYLVKTIIDGDTLVIDGDKRIRLAGIKAPDKDEEMGIEATDYLREMVAGKEVFVQVDEKNPKDSLGRIRAIVYSGKKNVNIEMVRAGFAHLFPVTPSIVGYDDWKVFEDEARENQKGLWSEKQKERESEATVELKDILNRIRAESDKKTAEENQKDTETPSTGTLPSI